MEQDRAWDARAYERVSSGVQLEWGKRLLGKKKEWTGNETVMDAGAGSGNLTRLLAAMVLNGHVYAVDADANMVKQARANLQDCKNVEIVHARMENARLAHPVDLVFSNAAIHWVLDQKQLFMHFYELLRPSGELLAEFGGHGSLEKILSLVVSVMQSDEFRDSFVNWKQAWHFPNSNEAEMMLKKAGFKDAHATLVPQTTKFPDRDSFASFVRTVILKPYLSYLTGDARKDSFVDRFLNEVQSSGLPWSLDYIRINISARK